jgi:hypothetical protein
MTSTATAGWKVEGSPGLRCRCPIAVGPCNGGRGTLVSFIRLLFCCTEHTNIDSTSIVWLFVDYNRLFTMSLQRSCRLLSQRAVFHSARQSLLTRPRYMSTAPGTTDTSTLPLAGIKVLDMTRVLAGVGNTISQSLDILLILSSHIALKYLET